MDLEEAKATFTNRLSDGTPVEIVYVSPTDQKYPILAVVKTETGGEVSTWCTKEGKTNLFNAPLVKAKPILPKDILCEVWDGSKVKCKRYSDGNGKFYYGGETSRTSDGITQKWPNYRVIENPPQPWFNDGECPIPEGCRYRVFVSGKWLDGNRNPRKWTWRDAINPTTAYQILGEKDEEDA